MKTTKFFSLVVFLIACVSCSSYDSDVYNPASSTRSAVKDFYDLSDAELSSDSYLPQQVAFALSLKYIDVYDGFYILRMTSEEAKDLKISPADFDAITKSVKETNDVLAKENIPADMAPINEAINNLFSYGSDDIINLKPMRSSGEATGIIPILDNDGFYTTSIFVPLDYHSIIVTCSSQAPLGMCVVRLYYGVDCIASKTVMTPLGVSNSCEIEVPYSNVWFSVGVMASSVNGGFFSCRLGER